MGRPQGQDGAAGAGRGRREVGPRGAVELDVDVGEAQIDHAAVEIRRDAGEIDVLEDRSRDAVDGRQRREADDEGVVVAEG